ncbi:MAG: thioredoxin domain-containing protein [Bacteroidota bacterium]
MNHLQHETSPYLLQHAHNPVDWYAWKPEAFERARQENKPILVSIGYSTCHWCHVMERESFENESVAAFMNKHFINIKVDREERPDVDQIYMEACQLINGSGCGWPLNCFLLPDGRPFYAGTYFPPQEMSNRPSWAQVLQRMTYMYNEEHENVEAQAQQLIDIINNSDTDSFKSTIDLSTDATNFTKETLAKIYKRLEARYDRRDGGFGGAPKFPSTFALRYLLHYHYRTGEPEALHHVHFSLEKMIYGGIYDQLGGGFSRYTVDRAWQIPHFEKMLYDNALLVKLLAELHQYQPNELYQTAIAETLTFIEREMTHKDGGFYAALDADSEGVEGKFYVWQQSEIEELLDTETAQLFNKYYQVSKEGNWEDTNILYRNQSAQTFAKLRGLDIANFQAKMQSARAILLEARAQRIRPGLDDKILLDWNALMCTAYVKAYQALGHEEYKTAALRNIEFLFDHFPQQDHTLKLYHTYKDGQAQYDAFLNDYAYLIEALLHVYTLDFKTGYIDLAAQYADFVIAHFLDRDKSLFYFTSDEQDDLVTRKIDIYDSAMPSGNSVMIYNLQQLSILLDRADYRDLTTQMLQQVEKQMTQYAPSFANWSLALFSLLHGQKEIAILGKDAELIAQNILQQFLPQSILMASAHETDDYPLLKDKIAKDNILIYLCENYACQQPVEDVDIFLNMIS